MRMNLLHAFTVILTVLLFVVRLRYTYAGTYSEKRRSIRHQYSQHDSCDKPEARPDSGKSALEGLELFLSNPKYKRDPEIDVDSEEIGYEPLM